MLLLKLAATLAALICGGCIPPIAVTPTPAQQPVELKITIDGEGKIKLDGDAKIDVAAKKVRADSTVCSCGCNLEGCACGLSASSAAQNQPSAPQVLRYERRQVCENGVCRIVNVPVYATAASTGLATAAPGGKIRVLYAQNTDTVRQLRVALADFKNVDFDNVASDRIPLVGGTHWTPTVVRADGNAWAPTGGWHAGSAAELAAWLARP